MSCIDIGLDGIYNCGDKTGKPFKVGEIWNSKCVFYSCAYLQIGHFLEFS